MTPAPTTARPMQRVEADALVLLPMTADHADAMFALVADPDLYRHVDEAPPPSAEHLRSVYARREARQSPDGAQTWLNWVIELRQGSEPGPMVGYVQATVTAGGDAWVAYMLAKAHWGQGHAGRAVRAMLPHLVAAYGAQRFLATVEVDNHRSVALLRRLGFDEASAAASTAHELTPTERLYAMPAAGMS